MDKLIDLGMTKLFQLAEYVCSKYTFDKCEPAVPQSQQAVPTIRFSYEDKMTIFQENLLSLHNNKALI